MWTAKPVAARMRLFGTGPYWWRAPRTSCARSAFSSSNPRNPLRRAARIPRRRRAEHLRLTRRYFLRVAGLGLTAPPLTASPLLASAQVRVDLPPRTVDTSEYLTRDRDFGTVERGDPLPYTLSEPKLRAIGMTR